MTDQSATLARFLVEESRAIPEQHLPSVLRDRFPRISYQEFMRGFAIAEETAVLDALEPQRVGV